jgi:trimeric autotransporter adhesin
MRHVSTSGTRTPAAPQQTPSALAAGAIALCLCTITTAAIAAPTGGVVSAGQATVSAQGSNTRIQQSSARAIVNWQGFDVAVGESVTFVQPSASAITLNRVSGINASSIAGNLTANGRIFIVNPNGVVFGPTARVNTAGLVATTADIDNTSFMQGRYEFRTRGNDNAQISNQGVITTSDGGRVALLGPTVENTGTINANRGVVYLAGGQVFLVDLFGDGLVQVASAHIYGGTLGPPVTNIGAIQVGAGTVLVRSMLQPVQGSINGVDVANLASAAVTLPGGTIAFIGTPANVQSAVPTWVADLIPAGTQFQGAGIIDATPVYSFQPTQVTIAGAGGGTAQVGAPRVTDTALVEFNRLPNAATDTTMSASERRGPTLYTIASRSQPLRDAPAVADSDPPSPRTARPAVQAANGKRFCTVTEVMHSGSAQGCR